MTDQVTYYLPEWEIHGWAIRNPYQQVILVFDNPAPVLEECFLCVTVHITEFYHNDGQQRGTFHLPEIAGEEEHGLTT